MPWEPDAINLLVDMGLTRTSAVSLVTRIKADGNLTAAEAGVWAKVVTILGGVAVIAGTVARPSTNGQLIQQMANSHVSMMRAAMGGHRNDPCRAECWYPTPGKGNRWELIVCPLERGHKGLHADANLYPFWTTEDAEFFARQHALVTE